MLDALAQTWQGTLELTDAARSRCVKPARDLARHNFSPADVPDIAAYVRARDHWRTGPITPQTIAQEAAAWRSSGGALPEPPPPRRASGAPRTPDEANARIRSSFEHRRALLERLERGGQT